MAEPDSTAGSTGYVTRALAVDARWYVCVAAGITAPIVLVVVLKLAHQHVGAMKRLADWLTH